MKSTIERGTTVTPQAVTASATTALAGPRRSRPGSCPLRTTSPRRPLGRKIRIRMRIENAKMSLYSAPKAPPVSSDRYEAAKASSSPSTSPPSIAPGMLPMPPSTAAVKALSPGMKPVYGLIRLYCTPNSTPAAAAHGPADEEGQRDDPVDVDAHEARGRLVLGHRADRLADLGPVDQRVQRPTASAGRPTMTTSDLHRDVDGAGELEALVHARPWSDRRD